MNLTETFPMSDEARRIAELEEQLRATRAEVERYRSYFQSLSRDIPLGLDDDPPTKEEVQRMLTNTDGTPILDIVAELERGLS